MNFTDFTDELSEEFGLTKQQSRRIITFLINRLRSKILFGHEVSLRLIGVFLLRIRKPKKFLNLSNGKIETSKISYYLDFKPTEKIKKELKNKTVHGI